MAVRLRRSQLLVVLRTGITSEHLQASTAQRLNVPTGVLIKRSHFLTGLKISLAIKPSRQSAVMSSRLPYRTSSGLSVLQAWAPGRWRASLPGIRRALRCVLYSSGKAV